MGARTSTSDRLERLRSEGKLPIPIDGALELERRGVLDLSGQLVPPLVLTPTPSTVRRSKHYRPDLRFDVDEVCRVHRCLSSLRHTKGRRWAGKPLRPEPWQVLWIVAPVWGWRSVEGLRVVREGWVEVGRKNGKSTLCSGCALILLTADREPGAEVYAAATGRDQARQVFDPAKEMAIRSPLLAGKVQPRADLLRVPKTGSFFRVLSRLGDAAHGLNPSGAVIDEIHVHKSRDLIDAIDTGTGARDQPLILYITTSDDGSSTSIYAEKRDDVEALALDHGEPDHSVYGVVWSAPEDLDPFSVEAMTAANPNIGVSVPLEYLQKKAERARRSPSFLPTYERLHLNRRRSAVARAIDMDAWRSSTSKVELPIEGIRRRLRDQPCSGGLDLATTTDFAAWALVFPEEMVDARGETAEGVWIVPRLWIPRAAVEKRTSKVVRSYFAAWESAGWITITDGDVIDFGRIEDEIGEDAEAFQIGEFAFDAWQGEMLRQRLLDGGLLGWKCAQTIEALAPATQEFDRLLGLELVRTGGNPALEWMASNVVAKADTRGRWKPEKDLSPEKIDGFVASMMGLAAKIRPDRERVTPAAAYTGTDGAGSAGSVFDDSAPLDL